MLWHATKRADVKKCPSVKNIKQNKTRTRIKLTLKETKEMWQTQCVNLD